MISRIPWDSESLGVECFELNKFRAQDLFGLKPGHYTVKVDPLSDKKALHEAGFYYCDTLLNTYCNRDSFRPFYDDQAALTCNLSAEALNDMCCEAFLHGRFHRDFEIPLEAAELRYLNWAKGLLHAGKITGFVYNGEIAGFVAIESSHLMLHAMTAGMRGRGIAKYFWTLVCEREFEQGANEITSSISAANMPIVNLYTRLGFGFRTPKDVYHKVVS